MTSTPASNALQPLGEALPKSRTGIEGLDTITGGGLPTGRATLLCGGTGTGKTMLALEFLYRGIVAYGEKGVLMTFEESSADIINNVKSLGFDLQALMDQRLLVMDFVAVNPEEVVVSGAYNLDALFIRLEQAIQAVGAQRVVLDTIESLFSGLPNATVLRAELRRLFRWLKERGVTTIVTGESGDHSLTREGIEEYVSDCVINLTLTVEKRIASRSLRIIKYRGSTHGSNDYPFLINEQGVSLIPITAARLDAPASQERMSSGIVGLDAMLDGQGFYRGSSVLISGSSGTGKSTFMAAFARAACERHEKVLYCSFEESPQQIVRNMQSVGLDLAPYVERGQLHIESVRALQQGLDLHLLMILQAVKQWAPSVVIIDPITSLSDIATTYEVKRTLVMLVDQLKHLQITLMLGSLTSSSSLQESTSMSISSLIDSWIVLTDIGRHGERNRALYIRKSRGMNHANQLHEFTLSQQGVEIGALLDTHQGLLFEPPPWVALPTS